MSDDHSPAHLARHSFLARPPAWLAPAGFAALAVSTAVLFLVFSHFKLFNGMDALVYRRGADALWHGRALYAFEPGDLPFTYPPLAAVAFLPMLLVPPYAAAKALAVASLACLYLVIWIGLGMIGVPRGRGRAGLAAALTAAALWLEPVASNVEYGQINLVVLLLVLADLATPDRRWHKGVGVGLAAAVKLTPALFILYLLATRRWRAAAVATATFLAAAAVGLLATPHDALGFWSGLGSSADRVREATPLWYVGNQSLHGLLLRALHGAQSADRAWPAAAAVIVAATLWLATRASRTGNELLAAVVVSLGAVLVSPVSWTHHWVFVVLLPVLLLDAASRRTHLWPALLILVFLNWPAPSLDANHNPWGLVFRGPHFDAVPSQGPEPELHWTWLQHLPGEAYTLTALILLATLAFLPSRTPPQRMAEAQSGAAAGGPARGVRSALRPG